MTPTRRIAYLCLETPREGQAAHTHVCEIIAGFRARGWYVDLFATGSGGASSGASYAARLIGYNRIQLALSRRLTTFDAVYVRSHFAAWPTARLAALRHMPIFQEVNGRPDDLAVTYPWTRAFQAPIAASYRQQLTLADHVFAVTGGLAEWAKASAAHTRVSVIPNAANTDIFRPDGPHAQVVKPYVAFVGGLVAWHGIDTMLAAAKHPAWPPDVRLVVVGDGIEREKLLTASERGEVTWLGKQPYEDIPKYLRGADAALCVIEDPDGRSSTGVAPLKLFEAMACGTPVIVSDLPFQADVVRDEQAGVVVPPGDPEAIAVAVRRLVDNRDEARAMGRRGAAYVSAHASWRARANATADIMEAVIDRR